ncbi:polynucleotide kinase-phosphatase [Holophaga foetida]|uniref:polynucleotide kinase-phosphatase n=1 Tax=Holophaga foetida TaxID=35839 RepID=UPI0002471C4C|nr:polynucleotide kinase-phosphatase [Holophaga foetida]
MNTLTIPELSLVLLVGPSGSGKSTFARAHFGSTECVSSDFCRGLVSDDENDQAATPDAFEVLNLIVAKRLAAGRLTVVDATNLRPEDRKRLIALAREYHVLTVAIVFDLPERVCQERNRERPDRNFGPHVIRNQIQTLRRYQRGMDREGIRQIFTLGSPEEVAEVQIQRQRLWTNRRDESGPFDIIGDVHGCYEELCLLLERLGYSLEETPEGPCASHPEGRKVIFLGDIVDRGPRIMDALKLVMNMVAAGRAFMVPGNHEAKLLKKLQGRQVTLTHGLADTVAQLEQADPAFLEAVRKFIDGLIGHFVLDGGKLVVAHAGMKAEMQGRASGAARIFALYGESTGETDEYGLPVRYDWAADYRGKAMVVYGHTPVPEPEWLNNTLCLDTGCVFGGKLTALRYPEKELVSVPARKVYFEPIRPLQATEDPSLSAQQAYDNLLDLEDVLGKRLVHTRLVPKLTVREENARAALEVMSRFALSPKWLIYLPPTMSPTETSERSGYLEHPAEAFAYFRKYGVKQVVCEEKHMGSRAVVVLCRSEEVAQRRFGIQGDGPGACYTRTGRRFFTDRDMEAAFFGRLQAACESTGFWDRFQTDWVCLDCELMPWSAKAQELLKRQYAPVATAAQADLQAGLDLLLQAQGRGLDLSREVEGIQGRLAMARAFQAAYRQYCWPVSSLDDFRLAPFHLLATEGAVHTDQNHLWHMEMLTQLCSGDPKLMFTTAHRTVNLEDETEVEAGIQWWEALTGKGGEGMVVKPLDFISHGPRGLNQPAVKVRGREYLRIIYGPDYTATEHLERLRSRGLSTKRSMALREFALGIEALERFVRREPLRKVHECVFGVLAMESEPVDPRL